MTRDFSFVTPVTFKVYKSPAKNLRPASRCGSGSRLLIACSVLLLFASPSPAQQAKGQAATPTSQAVTSDELMRILYSGDMSALFLKAKAMLTDDPQNALAHAALGYVYFTYNRKEGLAEVTEAIRLDPKLPLAFVARGMDINRDPAERLKDLKMAMDIAPKEAFVHFNLGMLYFEQRQYVESEKEHKIAIELSPKYAEPHDGLGGLYLSQKRYPEAEVEYKRVMEMNPKDARVYVNLGLLHKIQKRYTEATKEYKRAIELDSHDPGPHINLGNLYNNLKRTTEAENEYKKAIELDPNNPLAHFNLGNQYYGRKSYKDAEKEYKQAIKLDPKYGAPHNSLGSLYYIQHRYAEAEKEYKRAIELNPMDMRARDNLSLLKSKGH